MSPGGAPGSCLTLGSLAEEPLSLRYGRPHCTVSWRWAVRRKTGQGYACAGLTGFHELGLLGDWVSDAVRRGKCTSSLHGVLMEQGLPWGLRDSVPPLSCPLTAGEPCGGTCLGWKSNWPEVLSLHRWFPPRPRHSRVEATLGLARAHQRKLTLWSGHT